MKYRVEWEEEIWDAFDEIECFKAKKTFEIEADSLEQAKSVAEKQAHLQIDKERPDKTHGMFFAIIIALIDENNVRYKLKNRQMIKDWLIVDVPDE